MRSTPPRHSALAITGAFLTLLTIGLTAPVSAQGGCEHPADRPNLNAGLLDLDGPKEAPSPNKPCTGARCSGNPAPVSTATAPSLPEPEARGLLTALAPVFPSESTAHARESASPRPLRNPSSIFHPPPMSA